MDNQDDKFKTTQTSIPTTKPGKQPTKTTDPLTGLQSRLLFYEKLQQAIQRAEQSGYTLALLLLNIDHFKSINNIYGFEIGDQLLQHITKRLQPLLNKNQLFARIGGDEFAIILEGKLQPDQIAKHCQHILDSIKKPFHITNIEINISARIGIATFPHSGRDINQLMNQADHALNRSRQFRHGQFEFYSTKYNQQLKQRNQIEHNLHHALKNNEIFLSFQPKLNIRTNQITGVEALARWRNPRLDIVSPADFIPICEDIGLIHEFGEWILRQCCLQCKKWNETFFQQKPLSMAVNLSVHQLENHALFDIIKNTLKDTQFNPHFLEFEITETTLLTNPEKIIEVLKKLETLGIRFSIDDFGTGYSSLNYLQFLPLTSLKIDRTFIRDIREHSNNAIIIKSIITLAHRLNLTVIAEGVETKSEFDFLKEHDCDQIQGYYVSPPLLEDELIRFLSS